MEGISEETAMELSRILRQGAEIAKAQTYLFEKACSDILYNLLLKTFDQGDIRDFGKN